MDDSDPWGEQGQLGALGWLAQHCTMHWPQ